ncbi:MAG: glycine-rich protein [Vallitalea sp.]|jgi:hypothetical protein|nr:glycine-rich protein [Vallitalea sp.]
MIWTFNNTSTGRNGTIQRWTVPYDGMYRIETFGARGGKGNGARPHANGGRGAKMKGEFVLRKGQIVLILVGQSGTDHPGTSSGGDGTTGAGGGGTFVAKIVSNSQYMFETGEYVEPLIVSAGGNGGADYGYQSNLTTLYHGISATGTQGFINNDYSGGGFLASRSSDRCGKSFLQGGRGALGQTTRGGTSQAGFGGGGSNLDDGYGGGGGGWNGGYRGQSAGSYNAGANQSSSSGYNDGQGKVIISVYALTDTKSASNIGIFSAKLNGEVYPITLDGKWYFEFGTTSSYGTTLLAGSGGTFGRNSYNYDLPELLPNTTYHYRTKIVESGRTTYGDDMTFTTKSGLATITTDTITATGATTADATGTIVSFNE